MCGSFDNRSRAPQTDSIGPLLGEFTALQSRLLYGPSRQCARECCEAGAAAVVAVAGTAPCQSHHQRPLSVNEFLVYGVGAGGRGPVPMPSRLPLPLSLENEVRVDSPVHQVIRPTPAYPYTRRPSFSQPHFKWQPALASDCRIGPGNTQELMYPAVLQPCPTPRLLSGLTQTKSAEGGNSRPFSDFVRVPLQLSPTASFEAAPATMESTALPENQRTSNGKKGLEKSDTYQSLNSSSTTQRITAL